MSTDAPEQTIPVSALYKWSAWVHVGPGAEQCEAIDEERGTNDCSDPLHHHFWCRLPNQYQHRDIREAALAAKARRARQYRDPDSDASVILDAELEAVGAEGEGAKRAIVDELLAKDWWRDYMEAQADVRELEDEGGAKTYEHIGRDMTRWQELAALDAEERPADEWAELEGHITAYNEAVDKARAIAEAPRREALEANDVSTLLDMLRKQRVDVDSNGQFSHEYATLEWLSCTLRKPDGEPAFASREILVKQDEQILEALKATYIDLESTHNSDQGGASGNS